MYKSVKLIYGGLVVVTLTGLVATVVLAGQWWQSNTVNQYIQHPEQAEQRPNHPYALFAQAYYQMTHQQQPEALAILTSLLEQADTTLKPLVLYNRGNIYLSQAFALHPEDKKRLSLIELAKQDYRQALSLNPQLRDARFNLELALRLVPEPEQGNISQDKPQALNKKTIESYGFRADLP